MVPAQIRRLRLEFSSLALLLGCFAPGTVPADAPFVHLAEFSPSLGGMESAVQVTYSSREGLVQESSETDQERILQLGTAEVDTAQLFDFLRTTEELPASRSVMRSNGREIVEGLPARMRIVVQFAGGQPIHWTGDRATLPAPAQAIAERMREFASANTLSEAPAGRYIRARWLAAGTARRLAREGLVTQAQRSDIEAHPALARALAHPYRLVPVSEADLARPPLASHFGPERPLFLSVDGQAFRVGVLILAGGE